MAGIRDTFSKGLTTLNVKTSTILEQNKINAHISTLENEIEALKNKAGHILWDKWKDGTFSMTDVEELMLEINAKVTEIKVQRKRAEEVRQEESRILGAQQGAESGVLFCSNCGTQGSPNSRFCTKCGSPLNR